MIPDDASYADVDPVPLALEWLGSHQRVLAEVGGSAHISGLREAPFPHLVVAAGGETTFSDGVGPMDSDLALEVWDDPAGTIGPARLRRISIVVCEALRELPWVDYVHGRPVVSRVRVTRGPHAEPLASGQRRYSFTVSLRMTPPTPAANPAG